MLPIEINGTLLNKDKLIDDLNVGELEVLLLEVRTIGNYDSSGIHKSPFAFIEAKNNILKKKT